MKKIEMTKLLTFNNGKLMIEGYDLVEIANMYRLSVHDFLTLFKLYLNLNQDELKASYVVSTVESEIFTPTAKNFKIETETSGEILVASEGYEDMKKRIFDFAYINCSKIGDTNFERWGLSCAEEYDLERKVKNLGKTYSCIYRSLSSGWNQKTSNIMIDTEDQEKRYTLLRNK